MSDFDKKKKLIGIFSLIIFLLLSVSVFILIGKPLISFASSPEKFRNFIDSFGAFGRIVFIFIIVLQVIVAIIPGEPFEIAAGYTFGYLEGCVLCLIGIIIGSAIVFWLVKKYKTLFLEAFFSKEKIQSISFLKNHKKLDILFFLLMFIPGTPKDLLSYFAGLTPIKLSAYLIIVSVARIPSVITSTVGGNALGTKKYTFAIIVFASTLLLSGAGLIIYKIIQKKNMK